jgi:transcriptional regulator
MYIRKEHRLDDRDQVFSLIEQQPLGAWVYGGGGTLTVNHVPFLLDRSRGPHGTLLGHVSRANTIWRELDTATSSVVIFQGPQAYVSPGWYPGKAEHGKVVPTWDYAVVHAHGTARVVEDPEWLLDMLNRLTNTHEAGQPAPWSVGDAPAPYIGKLMRAVVGIEISIDRLDAKLKASQDEDMQDRIGTVAGLRGKACPESERMAALVQQAIDAETLDGAP